MTPSPLQARSSITVAVGMSGGVDSSVTASLLKEQGYRVVGLFMKNWEETLADGSCTSAEDFADVEKVATALDIPYTGIEFVKEYRESVFAEFLRDYKMGHTPNPDILCNREIKFQAFLKYARDLGADVLATGHYCQNGAALDLNGEVTERQLWKGRDPSKDQSYFVYTLGSQILDQVMFPIGSMLKSEVREYAKSRNLPTHSKKDSTGICFIGERDFRSFLSQYVAIKPGPIRELESGKKVGTHSGVAFYTMGQRKGLGLGGEGDPWFVCGKDVEKNTLFVVRGRSHPALFAQTLEAVELSFVSQKPMEFPLRARAKVRYRQADQDCWVEALEKDRDGRPTRIGVRFDEPQRAITERQSVVLYTDGPNGESICLGGGIIDCKGATLYELGADRNWQSDLRRAPLPALQAGLAAGGIAGSSVDISQTA